MRIRIYTYTYTAQRTLGAQRNVFARLYTREFKSPLGLLFDTLGFTQDRREKKRERERGRKEDSRRLHQGPLRWFWPDGASGDPYDLNAQVYTAHTGSPISLLAPRDFYFPPLLLHPCTYTHRVHRDRARAHAADPRRTQGDYMHDAS